MIDWFKWNGVSCKDYDMTVLTQPTIFRAMERVEKETIRGRSGSLTLLEGEDVYDDIQPQINCIIDDANDNKIARISGWLRGPGEIVFANQDTGFFKGRLSGQVAWDKIVRGNPHMGFPLQFTCSPYLYLLQGGIPFKMTSATVPVMNPGNVGAAPLLKVTGSGEGVILLGGGTIFINDFSNLPAQGMTIDCEARVAYKGELGSTLNPLILLANRVSITDRNWPRIPPGPSYIAYSGGITSVEVTPRWRNV